MKVYVSHSLRQPEMVSFIERLSFIERQLRTHDAKSVFNFRPHLLNPNQNESEKSLLAHTQKLKKLREACDLGVFEVSQSSTRIGAEISHLLEKQRPILILAKEGSPDQEYFASLDSHHILYAKYSDDLSLKAIIDSFFHSITDYSEARLTLHLEKPYIDFLEGYMKKNNLSMARAIEQIVEDNIEEI